MSKGAAWAALRLALIGAMALSGALQATAQSPGIAAGETVVSPEEFEALSTGTTMTFDRAGQRYGAEQYLEGRRVIWQYADTTCSFGIWFPRGTDLCFVYDTGPDAQCWRFVRRGGQTYARSVGEDPFSPNELQLSSVDTTPLDCPAPNLGV